MKGWVGLAAAFLTFLTVMVAAAHRGSGFDLAPVVIAGQLVSTPHAESIYSHDPVYYNRVSDPHFLTAARDVGFLHDPTPFVYPPLVASIAHLGSGASFERDSIRWAWISAVALAAGLALALWIYLPHQVTPGTLALALLAFCVFEPALYGFWLGQTTAVLFLVVMGAIAMQRRGHSTAAGVFLAVAIYVKITPLLLALLWLWRGPRRAAYLCGSALAVFWLLSIAVHGIELNTAYVARVLEISRAAVVALNNHSLPAFLARLAVPPAPEWQTQAMPAWVPIVALTVGVAIVLSAGGILGKMTQEQVWRPPAESLAFALMLFLPNIAWTHYFVFLVPALCVLVSLRRPKPAFARVVSVAAFLMCCRYVIPPQEDLPTLGPHLMATAPTFAVLLVSISILIVLRQSLARGHAVLDDRR